MSSSTLCSIVDAHVEQQTKWKRDTRRLERRADKEALARNSILKRKLAGETISVSPLRMSRVLLRACSGKKEKKRKRKKKNSLEGPLSVCKRIFHYFNGVTCAVFHCACAKKTRSERLFFAGSNVGLFTDRTVY